MHIMSTPKNMLDIFSVFTLFLPCRPHMTTPSDLKLSGIIGIVDSEKTRERHNNNKSKLIITSLAVILFFSPSSFAAKTTMNVEDVQYEFGDYKPKQSEINKFKEIKKQVTGKAFTLFSYENSVKLVTDNYPEVKCNMLHDGFLEADYDCSPNKKNIMRLSLKKMGFYINTGVITMSEIEDGKPLFTLKYFLKRM